MTRRGSLLTAAGLLATGVALFAGTFYFEEANREIHLIPHGYSGPVVIVVERADGSERRDANGARLYEIPGNGVLLTKFRGNSGMVFESTRQFYYVLPNGSRERLPFVPLQWTENYQKSMTPLQLQAPSVYGFSFGTVAKADGTGRNAYYTYVVGALGDSRRLISLRDAQPVSSY